MGKLYTYNHIISNYMVYYYVPNTYNMYVFTSCTTRSNDNVAPTS